MIKLTRNTFLLLLLSFNSLLAQQQRKTDAIYSGIPWYDQNGKIVSAHGANIIQEKDKFYLFGEVHSDTSNAFAGFSCYSSKDLYNWKFESIALPVQKTGKLGPNRVGERVKVIKNPNTGEYIMFMHVDTLSYKDQFVGYAVAKNIAGPYQFKGPVLFNGKAIKKWDMGIFQDTDSTGYVLTHGGLIYKLSSDYKSIVAETNQQITSGFESPTLFKKDNTYYFIGSNLTSWEKNDNYYYTSQSLNGPWIARGLIAPKGTLTWNSQATFVLPIKGSKDTTFMFMGDRWSFPRQLSAATYVWQPITFNNQQITIPNYQNVWQINTQTGENNAKLIEGKTVNYTSKQIVYSGTWTKQLIGDEPTNRSDDKTASASINFLGKRIGIYSAVLPDNGYANIKLSDKKGRVIFHSFIDLYSKSPTSILVYLSPTLPRGEYKLTMATTAERPNWTDKSKTIYGSTGGFISINNFIINE